MKIDRIDHLVLAVTHVKAMRDFYARVLGGEVLPGESGRSPVRIGEQKLVMRKYNKTDGPAAKNLATGTSDYCFITSELLDRVVDHIESYDIEIIEGPVRKIGAKGPIESIYLYDPDGNLVEIANYH